MKNLETYIKDNQVNEGLVAAFGFIIFVLIVIFDTISPLFREDSESIAGVDADDILYRLKHNGVIVSFIMWIAGKVEELRDHHDMNHFIKMEEKLQKDPSFIAWTKLPRSKKRVTDAVNIAKSVFSEKEKHDADILGHQLFQEYTNKANDFTDLKNELSEIC